MSAELQLIKKKYLQLLESQPLKESELDYSVLNNHIPYLEKLDIIGNSAISIFDMYRKTHVYISPSYRRRLGLPDEKNEGPEGFDQLMHPEDLQIAMEAGYYFLKMAMTIKSNKLKDYRLINEYRIKNSDKGWMRMTEQHQILEMDKNGNIWLALSLITVSPNQNLNEPMSSRLVNHKTGKIISFAEATSFFKLSNREKEILQLISEGYISKQIANLLHISLHTVNTHRQNIIEKMEVANTVEAIQLASRMGILR